MTGPKKETQGAKKVFDAEAASREDAARFPGQSARTNQLRAIYRQGLADFGKK